MLGMEYVGWNVAANVVPEQMVEEPSLIRHDCYGGAILDFLPLNSLFVRL